MICIKCSNNNAYKNQIDRFNYITCPNCQYSITAKHYRAKLKEEAENENNPFLFKDKYGVIRTLTSDDIPF